MSPTITLPNQQTFQPVGVITERKRLLETVKRFFSQNPKDVYIVVQPRKEDKNRKKINALKPYLYELPDTKRQDLIAFNEIAPTNTFNSLSISVTQPDFVRSITDRSAALMVVLYFRLILEKVAPPVTSTENPALKSVLKNPRSVGDATGTGQATKTGTAGTKP
jgi:hypothetical protein